MASSDDGEGRMAQLPFSKLPGGPMSKSTVSTQQRTVAQTKRRGSATLPGPDPKALRESQEETVSKPGGFKNDPDDPTNPNEAIERSRRGLRQGSAKGGQ
jgi:hypothetical protein